MTSSTSTFFDASHELDPPYHFNVCYSNKTELWNGMDNRKLFFDHVRDSKSAELLKKLGWTSSNITYKFNSLGFRCDEFDDRPCGLALGCSFTQGVGLPVEITWPHLLSSMANMHVWNLGSGGASIETVFRIFEYSVKKLSPKFVCILLPPPSRFEFHDSDNGYPILMASNLGLHQSFAKDWLSQVDNGFQNQKKTVLAIERICDLMGIPLIIGDSATGIAPGHEVFNQLDLARDLAHRGHLYQRYHAKFMFDKLQNLMF